MTIKIIVFTSTTAETQTLMIVCVCLTTRFLFTGKKHLESAVLHCLCLLDLTLQKEVVFMDLLRESQASLLVSPLEQLLQGVSSQTRRADHIVNIARWDPAALFSGMNLHLSVFVENSSHQKRQVSVFVLVLENKVSFFSCRYLYHSSSNPEAAFQSAKILRRIATYPNIQMRLVGDFTHDQVSSNLPAQVLLLNDFYHFMSLLNKFNSTQWKILSC